MYLFFSFLKYTVLSFPFLKFFNVKTPRRKRDYSLQKKEKKSKMDRPLTSKRRNGSGKNNRKRRNSNKNRRRRRRKKKQRRHETTAARRGPQEVKTSTPLPTGSNAVDFKSLVPIPKGRMGTTSMVMALTSGASTTTTTKKKDKRDSVPLSPYLDNLLSLKQGHKIALNIFKAMKLSVYGYLDLGDEKLRDIMESKLKTAANHTLGTHLPMCMRFSYLVGQCSVSKMYAIDSVKRVGAFLIWAPLCNEMLKGFQAVQALASDKNNMDKPYTLFFYARGGRAMGNDENRCRFWMKMFPHHKIYIYLHVRDEWMKNVNCDTMFLKK